LDCGQAVSFTEDAALADVPPPDEHPATARPRAAPAVSMMPA